MAENDTFIRGEILNLFWNYFHDRILEEKLGEQMLTDLKEVNK